MVILYYDQSRRGRQIAWGNLIERAKDDADEYFCSRGFDIIISRLHIDSDYLPSTLEMISQRDDDVLLFMHATDCIDTLPRASRDVSEKLEAIRTLPSLADNFNASDFFLWLDELFGRSSKAIIYGGNDAYAKINARNAGIQNDQRILLMSGISPGEEDVENMFMRGIEWARSLKWSDLAIEWLSGAIIVVSMGSVNMGKYVTETSKTECFPFISERFVRDEISKIAGKFVFGNDLKEMLDKWVSFVSALSGRVRALTKEEILDVRADLLKILKESDS